jgi:hypothetical protein
MAETSTGTGQEEWPSGTRLAREVPEVITVPAGPQGRKSSNAGQGAALLPAS